ncbi:MULTISPECIES: hypothetical protein [Collimonas]|uniref:hypothetical protein n=1 Tax=Collimonas TaxID=202907 RepID=UPI000FE14455|nr:hypothetical protein [Collimonas arenae]
MSEELRVERKPSDGSADRPTLVARLLNGGFDSLSPLQDAAVTWIYNNHILITGIQTDEVLQRSFSQSWKVKVLELTTQQKVAAQVD